MAFISSNPTLSRCSCWIWAWVGKTVISLFAILSLLFDRFEVSKVLVAAPLRVAKTVWPEELRKWDGLDFLRMSVVTGSAAQREVALRASADVYVINRENVDWLVRYFEQHRISWPFDMVVLDELSSFKSHESRRWKAIRKIRPFVKRMVGLTGTPAGNGLMDLWAETYLIDNGQRLGRFIGRYREAYFKPASMNPHTGQVYSYALRPGAEKQIYGKIADISVSMKAADFLNMPDCVMVNHTVELEPAERKLYDRMKEELFLNVISNVPPVIPCVSLVIPSAVEGSCPQQTQYSQTAGDLSRVIPSAVEGSPSHQIMTVDAKNAATLSNKLLQMANGAVYTDEREVAPIHTRKLDALEDLIEQANGQSVLIAYWFQHDRDRILSRFPEARVLQSDQDIADWNAGRIPVALISPASAGHGLNIQRGGHILIWFSLVWSLELYQQTNARLWRQGQKEVVTIHHLVMKDTIDEQVLSALKRKDVTQQNLINAVKAQL